MLGADNKDYPRYRMYFDREKLDDRLLKTYVTDEIAKETSEYVESFAFSLGVSPNQIALPTPYIITRFATLFAYMTVAQRQSQFSKGNSADNDSFALKFKMYWDLLRDLEKSLTADSFTNGQTAKKRKFPMTIGLLRN